MNKDRDTEKNNGLVDIDTSHRVEAESNPDVLDSLERREMQRMAELIACVGKVDVFSDDIGDEFKVIREDGSTQGIFKTWAVPVMPFLEANKLDELSKGVKDTNDMGFWEAIGTDGRETIERWSDRLRENPIGVHQTLEHWRGWSETQDRRLTEIFLDEELPEDADEASAVLLSRLLISFAYSAPFYHLEAMVADMNETEGNPIRHNENHSREGGALDMAGMLLPAALNKVVESEQLNWNGTNWNSIVESLHKLDDHESKVVLRLSARLGVEPADVVFAANVLEWIPVSVGGKKNDIDSVSAQEMILEALERTPRTVADVARDANAKIRFLNWFPAVRTDENFTSGTSWRYAAVCDTASSLLQRVEAGGVLDSDFESIFQSNLASQVQQLDATSAKGRFMVQLFEEGKFSESVIAKTEAILPKYMETVSKKLVEKRMIEAIVELSKASSRTEFGGKAAGIWEAAMAVGSENVIDGVALNTDFITALLDSDEQIRVLMHDMQTTSDIDSTISIGDEIVKNIDNLMIPVNIIQKLKARFSGEKLVVRSSSSDEDSTINGSAAGIYESVEVESDDVEDGVKHVVKSFFMHKAVTYRHMQGLPHTPSMSVVVTSLKSGPGGAIFTEGNSRGWNMNIGASPKDVVEGKDTVQSIDVDSINFENRFVDTHAVEKTVALAMKIEDRLGGKIDMEFIIPDGRPIALQNRAINLHTHKEDVREAAVPNRAISIDDLSELSDIAVNDGDILNLVLGENIDIEQFQGDLFRFLTINKGAVAQIDLPRPIPGTSHFANIAMHLGIKLHYDGANK